MSFFVPDEIHNAAAPPHLAEVPCRVRSLAGWGEALQPELIQIEANFTSASSSHLGEGFLHVLSGHLVLHIGDERFGLEPGDSAQHPSTTLQSLGQSGPPGNHAAVGRPPGALLTLPVHVGGRMEKLLLSPDHPSADFATVPARIGNLHLPAGTVLPSTRHEQDEVSLKPRHSAATGRLG
ncbi:hypothetical protein GCM10022631_15640 [Deinococcus rubellus]